MAAPLESPRPPDGDLARAWAREAERLHARYEREIVLALNLCPWAKRARENGAVRTRVLLGDADLVARALGAIDELDVDPRAEVAFLIFPRLAADRRAFEELAARVREGDAARRPVGGAPFVFAAFHPDAAPDTSSPERAIPFLRRSPDPTLQLLRASVVERVRASAPQGTQFVDAASLNLAVLLAPSPPPLREQIAATNLHTLARVGVDDVTRRMAAIFSDRDATYRALDERAADGVHVSR